MSLLPVFLYIAPVATRRQPSRRQRGRGLESYISCPITRIRSGAQHFEVARYNM